MLWFSTSLPIYWLYWCTADPAWRLAYGKGSANILNAFWIPYALEVGLRTSAMLNKYFIEEPQLQPLLRTFSFMYNLFYAYKCLPACMSCTACTQCLRNWMECQIVVSHTAWTLGTELETSVSAWSAFKCWAISSARIFNIINYAHSDIANTVSSKGSEGKGAFCFCFSNLCTCFWQ